MLVPVCLAVRVKEADVVSAVMARLAQGGVGDLARTGAVAEGLGGLVSGGFLQLGYIPVSQAVGQCEGKARYLVERAVDRLRKQGEEQFAQVGEDLEAR